MENQIGELTRIIYEKTIGGLLHNSEKKSDEHVKAVTLWSGKELVETPPTIVEEEKGISEAPAESILPEEKEGKQKEVEKRKISPPPHRPPIMFPRRMLKEKQDEQYSKFMEIFKQLHISLPLVDVMIQMPKYVKFLKEAISGKRRLEDVSSIMMYGECSTILNPDQKLPEKLKDLRSFTIPCTLGGITVSRVLAYLGASIHLMPYNFFYN